LIREITVHAGKPRYNKNAGRKDQSIRRDCVRRFGSQQNAVDARLLAGLGAHAPARRHPILEQVQEFSVGSSACK
jgi:hypothetical protein